MLKQMLLQVHDRVQVGAEGNLAVERCKSDYAAQRALSACCWSET